MSDTGIEFVRKLAPSLLYRKIGRVLSIEAEPNLTEDLGRVFTENVPPVYFGTYPTEHTFFFALYSWSSLGRSYNTPRARHFADLG